MSFEVNNAIIMAAGTSSRFAPLSYEKHKGLTVVRGEVLIERQIKQIIDAGINEIFVVTGYKAEQFEYLKERFGVKLLFNPDYLSRNNNGSIWVAKDILHNSYVCSADNYFCINPFERKVEESYYAAEYSEGETAEWCMKEDQNGYIDSVSIGGSASWYMLGHTFWNENFSKKFIDILEKEYELPETKDKLWEKIFMAHLDELKMKIKKYEPGVIFEFDSLDELREFDNSYIEDTRSELIKKIAKKLNKREADIKKITSIKGESNEAVGFAFKCNGQRYKYRYEDEKLEMEGLWRNYYERS